MPCFIGGVIERAKTSCANIVSMYTQHTQSLVTDVKTYIATSRNFIKGRNATQAEAAAIVQLQRKYASCDIKIEQLLAQEYSSAFERVRDYSRYCEDKSNTIGDKNADECKIPSEVQECFNAAFVLERNSSVVSALELPFHNALYSLIQRNGILMSITIDETQNVRALLTHVIHDRLPALYSALDCRAHSYVFINELNKLLIALQDACIVDWFSEQHSTQEHMVSLACVWNQYTHNSIQLSDSYTELAHLRDKCAEAKVLVKLPYAEANTQLIVVLAVQLMLTMMSQKELSHIMHNELTETNERIMYDYFVDALLHNDCMTHDLKDGSLPLKMDMAHVILIYRLKHMLHTRITYLIVRQQQQYISQLMQKYAQQCYTPSTEPQQHIAHEQENIRFKLQVLADMLSFAGNISHAVVYDILLHIRSKVILQILKAKKQFPSMHDVIQYLLSETQADVVSCITHSSVKHSLSTHRMQKTVAATLQEDEQIRAQLRKYPIFQGVIRDTFTKESNSKFTQYLCHRADCFIVGLCCDSELCDQLDKILQTIKQVTISSEQQLHNILDDNSKQNAGTIKALIASGSTIIPFHEHETSMPYSDTEIDTDTEQRMDNTNTRSATVVIDNVTYPSFLFNRQIGRIKLHDVKRVVRNIIDTYVCIFSDTDLICSITEKICSRRARGFCRQLDMLNDACATEKRKNIQGIHLSYWSAAGILMISDNIRRTNIYSDVYNVVATAMQYTYRFTVFSIMVMTCARAMRRV